MDPTSEEFKRKHENELEMAKRELQRRSLDTIRVYNPLNTEFAFMYDRYWHRIPAKSQRDFPRYLALHFFKKICDKMIGDEIQEKGGKLKATIEEKMGTEFKDKYEENVQVWDKVPKMNDPQLIDQIRKVVLVGLVEEYGMDEPEPDTRVPDEVFDYRGLHEQVFTNALDKLPPLVSNEELKPVNEVPIKAPPEPKKDKKKLEEEITNDN